MEKPTAETIIDSMKRKESERSNWDTLYQDCADHGMPANNQITNRQAAGEEKDDLFDTTAEESNIQLAAGLYSYMFPTDGRAFVLEVEDPELAENDDVTQWLEQVTKIIHKHLIKSNFRESFFEYLKSLGCFGTADLHVEKGKRKPLVFTTNYMGDVYIEINSDKEVDTVYRNFEFSARQAVQKFGEKALGDKVNEAYKNPKKREKKFKFIHAIEPRSDYDLTKDDPVNMPIASYYVCRKDKNMVSESGYHEMPDMVSFFDKDAREDLGRSPMMKKLPDIKMAGAMKKCRIKGWEKQVDPPIMTPDDGSIWPLATQPGGVIHFRAGGDKPEYFKFEGDLNKLNEAIQSTQQDIKAGFFLDMFDPLIDRQNMTATEVMARIEQKMRFLTPIIGRLQSGLFNPMIHRIIGVLGRGGLLPPPPIELADYSVMYLGRLALAMRTLETEGLNKTLMDFAPLGDMNILDWLDNLDVDEAVRGSARNNGVPASWIKTIEARELKRSADADAARQQAMLQAIPEMAKASKAAGTTPGQGSITEGVIDAVQK